jgi:hypothetical protein
MIMANIYDIKSKNVVIGTQAGTVSFGIGQVPAGKTRFITYVKATNINHGVGPTNTLYMAENAADSITGIATATASKKLTIPFNADLSENERQVPNGGPDTDRPLFTVAASHYLIGCTSRKPIDVFVQYYDE